MRARAAFRSAAALAAVVASPACDDFIRPPDPLEVDPDVVSVAIMLVAGEREARLLAAHPHRQSDEAPPTLTATLRGPGWTAAFSDTLELWACTPAGSNWPGPARCLRAVLPQEIRAGEGYEIEGTAPLGPFSGEVVLPVAPVLLEPGDSLHLPMPTEYEYHDPDAVPDRVRRRHAAGGCAGRLPDGRGWHGDGTRIATFLGYFAEPLEGAEADTVRIHYHEKPLRFSLRLLGIGWNYTNFLENEGIFPLPKPWPSFGIEGEGVYGYFDGVVPSRVSRVWVR